MRHALGWPTRYAQAPTISQAKFRAFAAGYSPQVHISDALLDTEMCTGERGNVSISSMCMWSLHVHEHVHARTRTGSGILHSRPNVIRREQTARGPRRFGAQPSASHQRHARSDSKPNSRLGAPPILSYWSARRDYSLHACGSHRTQFSFSFVVACVVRS